MALYQIKEILQKKVKPLPVKHLINQIISNSLEAWDELEPYASPPGVEGRHQFDNMMIVVILRKYDLKNTLVDDKGEQLEGVHVYQGWVRWLKEHGFRLQRGIIVGLLTDESNVSDSEDQNGNDD